jgi:hypothetical protein
MLLLLMEWSAQPPLLLVVNRCASHPKSSLLLLQHSLLRQQA